MAFVIAIETGAVLCAACAAIGRRHKLADAAHLGIARHPRRRAT
ncbi:MAG: hypothetical protein SFW09_07935 [Hyphomicrobiaceae bacterium]|nr:hypothetical protein [Hyphomicrobiaceae bacterium]